jgi:hypothetical protein
MEGLFFEASGTTPYHFITAAAMSESSSNPVRELRYTNNDAEIGVQHMLDLGVRYVMLRTDPAKAEAAQHDGLEFVTTSTPWDIYEVLNSNIVEPLTVQPVIVNERSGDQRERNLEVGTSWFQRQDDWPAIPADDGPDTWQRIDVEIDMAARNGEPGERSRNVDYVKPVDEIAAVALPEITVSDIVIGQQSVDFSVDQVGVPVLIRVSYFPNWNVSGADGPYRVSPNHMVVIPTSNDVSLTYDRSSLDLFFYGLTALGIGLCLLWRRRGDMVLRGEFPTWSPAGVGEAQLAGAGAVNVVPNVWTPADPADEGLDPTPMYIEGLHPPDQQRSDIVINTSPPLHRDQIDIASDMDDDQGELDAAQPPAE